MPAGFSVLTLALAALASPAGAQAPARGPEANRLPAPLRAGLVLYYPFTDGTSDGVTDASGRGHAGKLQGGACVPAGRRGPALRFQDKAEITTPHAASLAFAESNSFTVAVWAWPDAASGDWQGVVVQSRLKPPFYGLYLEPGRKWVVYTGPLKGPAAEARWQHLALVQDGAAGKRRLYVDGRQVAEGPSQDSSGPGGLNVGSGGGGYAHFQGMLDELCIYKRALPETELRALMTATTDAGQAPASTTGQ